MLTDAGYVNTVGDDMTFNIIRGKCATTTGKGKGKKRFDLQAACCAPSRLWHLSQITWLSEIITVVTRPHCHPKLFHAWVESVLFVLFPLFTDKNQLVTNQITLSGHLFPSRDILVTHVFPTSDPERSLTRLVWAALFPFHHAWGFSNCCLIRKLRIQKTVECDKHLQKPQYHVFPVCVETSALSLRPCPSLTLTSHFKI